MTEVLARVGVDVRVGVAVAAVTGVLVIVGVNVNAFATKDTCTGIAHWPCDVDVGPRHTTFAALSVGGFGTVDVAVAVSVKLALPRNPKGDEAVADRGPRRRLRQSGRSPGRPVAGAVTHGVLLETKVKFELKKSRMSIGPVKPVIATLKTTVLPVGIVALIVPAGCATPPMDVMVLVIVAAA